MAGIAERTGVRGPSLYEHVASLATLQASVAERLLIEMTVALSSAAVGRSGADATAALMHSYRDYAVRFPGRYAAVQSDPLQNPRTADAAERQLDVILTVLRGSGVDGAEAIHITRILRAMVHGFADIESSGGVGLTEDINESFQRMVDRFLLTLAPTASPGEGPR